MSHISYFLPPYPTFPKAKLLLAIEYLESEDCGGETLLLLAAIAPVQFGVRNAMRDLSMLA